MQVLSKLVDCLIRCKCLTFKKSLLRLTITNIKNDYTRRLVEENKCLTQPDLILNALLCIMKFKHALLPLVFICFFSFSLIAQESNLIAPEGWRPEEIQLPLSFAPEIPITGVELVQFAPGWSKPETEEYFTYAFAWFLDDQKDFSAKDLEGFLIAYFDGLMGLVGGFEEVGTSVHLQKKNNKFQGSLTSKDGFFTKSELSLNLTIEKKDKGRIWLLRLSPKEREHEVWKRLNEEVRIFTK